MLRTSDLLKVEHFDEIGFERSRKQKFEGVSIDSRTITKNEIFFAIQGERTDGHKYIKDVFEKGVDAAVVNRKWFKKNSAITHDHSRRIKKIQRVTRYRSNNRNRI